MWLRFGLTCSYSSTSSTVNKQSGELERQKCVNLDQQTVEPARVWVDRGVVEPFRHTRSERNVAVRVCYHECDLLDQDALYGCCGAADPPTHDGRSVWAGNPSKLCSAIKYRHVYCSVTKLAMKSMLCVLRCLLKSNACQC